MGKRFENRFSVKKKGTWFWSTGLKANEIASKFSSKELTSDYLVCPHGRAELAVSIEEFLGPDFTFKPNTREESAKEKQQLHSRVEDEPVSAVASEAREEATDLTKEKPFRIFLSYRRADSIGVAGRMYDRLTADIGRERIFMDVDNIPLGIDFKEYLAEQIQQCNIVLVLIGKHWLGVESGSRRIDDPTDFVRVEVEAALQQNVPTIPILIGDVEMPSAVELPDSLKNLTFRNGMRLDPGPDFHRQMDRLVEAIRPPEN